MARGTESPNVKHKCCDDGAVAEPIIITDGVITDNLLSIEFPTGTLTGSAGVYEYVPATETIPTWDASAIGDLKRWFKADTGVTVSSIQAVSQWNDQSAAPVNIVQASADLQPTYCPKSLNGFPQIFFDGLDDVMTSSGSVITGANPRTTIFVGGWGGSYTTLANSRFLFAWGTGALRQSYGMTLRSRQAFGTIKPSFGFDYYGDDADGRTPPAETPFILMGVYDGTVDRMYHNGNLVLEKTVTLNTTTTNGFQVGRGYSGSLEGCFLVAEIAVFAKVFSSTERNNAFATLGAKYNIPVS